MNGAILRGLPLSAFDDMEVGAIADYVITCNNAENSRDDRRKEGKKKNNTVRRATQADWDKFAL